MTQQETRRWICRNKVMLALHEGQWDEAPCSLASNRDIMRETGFGAASVNRALAEWEAAGAIRIYPAGTAWYMRVIVVLSEPNALDLVEFLKVHTLDSNYDPDWREFDDRWADLDPEVDRLEALDRQPGPD